MYLFGENCADRDLFSRHIRMLRAVQRVTLGPSCTVLVLTPTLQAVNEGIRGALDNDGQTTVCWTRASKEVAAIIDSDPNFLVSLRVLGLKSHLGLPISLSPSNLSRHFSYEMSSVSNFKVKPGLLRTLVSSALRSTGSRHRPGQLDTYVNYQPELEGSPQISQPLISMSNERELVELLETEGVATDHNDTSLEIFYSRMKSQRLNAIL